MSKRKIKTKSDIKSYNIERLMTASQSVIENARVWRNARTSGTCPVSELHKLEAELEGTLEIYEICLARVQEDA